MMPPDPRRKADGGCSSRTPEIACLMLQTILNRREPPSSRTAFASGEATEKHGKLGENAARSPEKLIQY
jgi:hypothetical protein